MQWDVSIELAALLTLLIGACVGAFATLMAVVLSLSVFWFKIYGWKLAVAVVSSFLLVPIYVQATAWSAGFGTNGWLRLSQVDASKNAWMGIASVVWIHACAAIPFCFWIVSLGLRKANRSAVDQALVEVGPWHALTRMVLPRLRVPMAGSFLWAFASVQVDMVVTNLFQVPTLCESVYQQVQFGKLRSAPIIAAWAFAILCGLAIGFLGYWAGALPVRRNSKETGSMTSPVLSWPYRLILSSGCWTILMVCCVTPWMSLLTRMGFHTNLVQGARVRTWGFSESLSALWHVQDFASEFGWSVQLSLWAVSLSLLLTGILIWLVPRFVHPILVFGLLGCMITTPGPLINLMVGQLLNHWLPSPLGFLSDRTLLGPILAIQFRVLPVVWGLLWLLQQQYSERYGELLRLEHNLPWQARWYLWIRYSQWGWIIAMMIGFSVAFGDLASYLLVQPPGVTTIAMRMFDLLHYGTKNREAGLAVALALFGAISSLVCLRFVPSKG